jgi:hypothetical protein
MDVKPKWSGVQLAKEGLFAIRDGRSTRIVCETGSLWITQEGDSRDSVISAGESFTIGHQGLTILTALEPSRLEILEPDRSGTPARQPRQETGAPTCA